MTRSDSDDPRQGQGNPFDLGLPMLRTPTRKAKRRRSGRRAPRRRAEPSGVVPEPLPVDDDSAYEQDDWERWLDPNPGPRYAALPGAGGVGPNAALGREAGPSDDADAGLSSAAGDGSTRAARPRTRAIPDDLVDKSALVPTLIDRSGGNPGPRLRHPRRPREDNRRRDKLVAALIMIGLGVVVVAVVLTVIHTGKRATPATATVSAPGRASTTLTTPAPTTATAPAGAVAADGCEQRRSADVVSGTDPGGTGNGPDTILAFERAYYVQRSGFAARAVVADDAKVPTAEQIQRGINQVPVGTRYCVQITRSAEEGQWAVRLTQQKPNEPPHTFTQIITTRTVANRTLITAITEG
ncbi:hypothetical protein NDR87_19340 [Nocardia sp. CDC159]|uniref:DUF8176 domain-containing protein n=1 Tax=Nocardia pulmonis TaxID=2951408 RepID=A0A9X2IY96_9NOCA|nr:MULTISPECIES: hypothetical protein [Nocardia]MCM6776153.1 hypothetical protein [Nocardia pulmonis]MCM6788520.1 hypothetical protein [Nocardia sp. CDC159]